MGFGGWKKKREIRPVVSSISAIMKEYQPCLQVP